ncbi:MAG: hypothetical protein H6Q65_428 [Firmicutes bacterium]|nr:hypothetical protein [Bacillota bacterium]
MKENMLDWTIKEIVTKYPETLDVFSNNGFEIFAKEEVLNELGAVLKLRTALHSKKIGTEPFLHLLAEKIADAANYNTLLSSVVDNNSGKFNFVAQIPCGLKVPLERELHRVLQEIQGDSEDPINYYTGACCNDLLRLNDWIPHFTHIDEVPDLILSKGYHFFNKNFAERFIKPGYFRMPATQVPNKQLADLEIIDKNGDFQVVSTTTTIMVVDKTRLGDLPMPKRWGDLLRPEYEHKVMLNSYGPSFSDVVLLNIYKEYGEEGVEALGRAIYGGGHAAEMIKGMSSSKPGLPPIYIMADFFARTISSSDNIEIVWPEDGALAMPLFYLVKADKAEKMKVLLDFLHSTEFGQLCADARFPSLHPEITNKLPEGAKLKWLGWDFVMEHDIDALVEHLNTVCTDSFQGKSKSAQAYACTSGNNSGCSSDNEKLKAHSM